MNKLENRMKKAITTLGITLFLCISNTMMICASAPNYAEKGGLWILDNLFWVGLVALAFVLLKCLIARNFTSALISGIAGGLVLYFVKNPTALSDIGEKLATVITSAG